MPIARRTATTSTDRGVDVDVVEQHPALGARAGDLLVHAVDAADHRRLAASGGPDDRGDLVGLEGQVDALDAVRPGRRTRAAPARRTSLAGEPVVAVDEPARGGAWCGHDVGRERGVGTRELGRNGSVAVAARSCSLQCSVCLSVLMRIVGVLGGRVAGPWWQRWRFVLGCSSRAAAPCSGAAVEAAREDVQEQHEEDQQQRGGPRLRRVRPGSVTRRVRRSRTGIEDSASLGLVEIRVEAIEEVNSSGAVSPATRATASSAPGDQPARGGRHDDRQHRAPARDAEREAASFSDAGTSASTSCAERATIGSMMIASANAPA